MKKLLVFTFALFSPCVWGACHAVSPAGAGTHSGADWNNSMVGIPSTQVRGDIYYLADGAYSTTTFSQAASGTTPIEFRKAQSYDNGSSCGTSIAAGWNTGTMGSAQATFTNVTISTNYYIFNGNGTLTSPGCGAALTGTQTVAQAPPTPTDCGIQFSHSATNAIIFLSAGSNRTFEYVEILGNGNNANQEVIDGTSETFFHVFGHNSGCVYFQDINALAVNQSYLWGTEVNGGAACHGQAVFENGGQNNGVMSNTVWRDISGTAVWTFASGGTNTGWVFYNNIVVYSSPLSLSPSGGGATFGGTSDATLDCINGNVCSFLFYHNVIINCAAGSLGFGPLCGIGFGDSGTGGSITANNNLYYGNPGGTISLTVNGTTVTSDYNSFLNSANFGSGAHDVHVASGAPDPFTNWQGMVFTLASDNADWNNFLSLGSPYDTDIAGNSFTTDRGAYQFLAAGGTDSAAGVSISGGQLH